ncbi:hypothetical protein D3C76_863130 [compost metagenome]
MDTNKMREQFEAWVLREWPEQSLARFTTGEYQGFTVEHCWQAWKASREAVVVELPEAHKPAPEDDERWHNVRNSTIGSCRRAIEAQGLRVAP